MKKAIGILAGIATLAVGIYATNRVWAQQPGYAPQPATSQPAQPLQSRIALINLGQVIKNYQKFKNFEEELKSNSQWYQKQLEDKRAEATRLQGEMEKATDQATRDNMTKQIKDIQRSAQDLAEEGKTKLSKKEFDQLVQTYREVKDQVTRYARTYNIELVLHYNDGVGPDEYSPAIFPRKLANGACQPLYIAPGMDITGVIADELNRNMAATVPGAGAVSGQ